MCWDISLWCGLHCCGLLTNCDLAHSFTHPFHPSTPAHGGRAGDQGLVLPLLVHLCCFEVKWCWIDTISQPCGLWSILEHMAQVTPTLLARHFRPDKTRVCYDSEQVSPNSRGIFPTPDIRFVDDIVEGRPAWSRVVFCCRWKLINAADNTAVNASRSVLVILVGKLPANFQKMKLKDFLSLSLLDLSLLFCLVFLRHLILGWRQPLLQLVLVELLIRTERFPYVWHP